MSPRNVSSAQVSPPLAQRPCSQRAHWVLRLGSSRSGSCHLRAGDFARRPPKRRRRAGPCGGAWGTRWQRPAAGGLSPRAPSQVPALLGAGTCGSDGGSAEVEGKRGRRWSSALRWGLSRRREATPPAPREVIRHPPAPTPWFAVLGSLLQSWPGFLLSREGFHLTVLVTKQL